MLMPTSEPTPLSTDALNSQDHDDLDLIDKRRSSRPSARVRSMLVNVLAREALLILNSGDCDL
ncbi:hypothetical protein RSAG8_05085, partial [Rhizoctonia solani AG-8 WAC10335]